MSQTDQKPGLITYINNCIDLTNKSIKQGNSEQAIKHLEAALQALAEDQKWSENGYQKMDEK